MTIRERWWKGDTLVRELINGVETADNLGKTRALLGIPLMARPGINKPQPSSEWPIWARALRQLSKPEDKGIGDVVLRIIGNENSEAFKTWHLKIFNRPCNCDGRLAQWNALYPLP